jgi:hypothetical protein
MAWQGTVRLGMAGEENANLKKIGGNKNGGNTKERSNQHFARTAGTRNGSAGGGLWTDRPRVV